jgi:16S rRNA (guanine966-N2)-methyltransferase
VREAVFNILINALGNPVAGARVLDLFAGTGALGLEALSRGAARVAFVDDGVAARALLRRNIERARAMGDTDVWRRDATRLGENRGPGYGLVFLDPPYGKGLGEAALGSAVAGGWLAPGAVVVWEEGAPVVPPPGFAPHDARRYGDTAVTFLKAPG